MAPANEMVEFLLNEETTSLSEWKSARAVKDAVVDTITLRGYRVRLAASEGDFRPMRDDALRLVDYIETEEDRQHVIRVMNNVIEQHGKAQSTAVEGSFAQKSNELVQRIAKEVIAAAKAKRLEPK